MTLKDCTKEELIFIINRLSWLNESHLQTILHDVEYERVKKKLEEAEKLNRVASDYRQKFNEILKKHKDKKLTDIPLSEIKEAEHYLKEAEKADKKYEKLMKEVSSYGNEV